MTSWSAPTRPSATRSWPSATRATRRPCVSSLILRRSRTRGRGRSSTAWMSPSRSARAHVRTVAKIVVEGADAQSDRDGFDALLESTLVLTAALVVFLKDSFDASFVDSFNSLLRTHFYDERHVDARWAEAEPALRRHIVTGALDPRERERLFDAHMTGLRQRLGGDGVSS